jgi:hypothetical protein
MRFVSRCAGSWNVGIRGDPLAWSPDWFAREKSTAGRVGNSLSVSYECAVLMVESSGGGHVTVSEDR